MLLWFPPDRATVIQQGTTKTSLVQGGHPIKDPAELWWTFKCPKSLANHQFEGIGQQASIQIKHTSL